MIALRPMAQVNVKSNDPKESNLENPITGRDNIFISYCWKDRSIVDQLDTDLAKIGIILIRDVRDVKFSQDLNVFMQRVRTCDFVVPYISDSYLRSRNCMYETLLIFKESDFQSRIVPIVDDSIDFHSKDSFHTYLSYWEEQYRKEKSKVAAHSSKNEFIEHELNILQSICDSFPEYFRTLQGLLCSRWSELRDKNYDPLLSRVLRGKHVPLLRVMDVLLHTNADDQERAIEDIIQDHKKEMSAYVARAAIEEEKENHKSAVRWYSLAIELEPTQFLPYINRAGCLTKARRFQEARVDLATALRLATCPEEKAMVLFNRGVTYDNDGEHNKAIQDYNEAIELSPTTYEHYYNRGNSWRQLGRFDLALEDFSRAIEAAPDHESYYNRAMLYYQAEQWQEAIADLTRAIELNRNQWMYWRSRGCAQRELGCPEKAVADFNRTLELNPTNMDTYYNRAVAYVDLHRLIEAIEDYTIAHELDPRDAVTISNRGNAYFFLGDLDQAQKDYEAALRLDPDYAMARHNLGHVFRRRGMYARALDEMYTANARGFPNEMDILRTKAMFEAELAASLSADMESMNNDRFSEIEVTATPSVFLRIWNSFKRSKKPK